MQIERRRGSDIRAAEFGVAAIADRQIFQSTVDKQIDEHGAGENAVRYEIAAEPVEGAADDRADDDDGQPDLGIEILSTVEVGPVTDRAAIDFPIRAHRVADLQGDVAPAASASDRGRLFVPADRQARIAFRASGEDLQGGRSEQSA